MCDGYNGEEDHPGLEDEFLCEYVDGTMDPAVRAAFEDYLRANPALSEHVECLRRTRLLLCRYGCRAHAPDGLQHRLRRQLACEMMRAQQPLFPHVAESLRSMAVMASAMAVLLVFGMVAGVAVVPEEQRLAAQRGAFAAPGSALLPEVQQQAAAVQLPRGAYSRFRTHAAVFGGFTAPRASLAGAADTVSALPLLRSTSLQRTIGASW